MTALAGLLTAFVAMTLIVVIGLVILLRRRSVAGRKNPQARADGKNMPPPTAREET